MLRTLTGIQSVKSDAFGSHLRGKQCDSCSLIAWFSGQDQPIYRGCRESRMLIHFPPGGLSVIAEAGREGGSV